MAGFDNDVVYGTNVDFSGGFPVTGKVTTDGQLLIGSTASPNIRVGTIAAGSTKLAVTNGAGSISIDAQEANFNINNLGGTPLNVNKGGTGVATLTGIVAGNGTANLTGRTITGTANQITVTNGDGVAGNPTLSLTSPIQVSGISFDAGSNTLSNYEVGTFTPVIGSSGAAASGVYTTQVGRYTRIGNRLLTSIRVVCSSYTPGTGNTVVGFLPFASNNTTGSRHVGVTLMENMTYDATFSNYVAVLTSNSVLLTLTGQKTAAASQSLSASAPLGTATVLISMVYEV